MYQVRYHRAWPNQENAMLFTVYIICRYDNFPQPLSVDFMRVGRSVHAPTAEDALNAAKRQFPSHRLQLAVSPA